MMHYVVQTLAFQALFLLVYDLFLKKETFFNWNRAYLLVTAVLSFVLPFIKIEAIQQSVGQDFAVQLPAVLVANSPAVDPSLVGSDPWFSWSYVWLLGVVVALFIFTKKLLSIARLRKRGVATRFKEFTLIRIFDSMAAFTFFRTIFLGEDLSQQQREIVLQHEQVHVKQWHTIDLLFFEGLRVLCWFNPLVYIYQKRLTVLHEFIADRHVATQKGTSAYYQELLSQVFQTQNVSFVNTFFNHSLIKKRIIMLQKSKSRSAKLLKFALVLPLLAAMLLYVSCAQEAEAKNDKTEVMTKIEELSEAIMKKGNLTDEEAKALEFLATPAKEGDKVYESVEEYLEENKMALNTRSGSVTQDKDIPFAVVEKVPTYPGCSGTNDELKKCMVQKITQLVSSNFNTKLADSLKLEGKQRIVSMFKIDKYGNVVDIKSRAPHPTLESEAIRVLKLIPKMKPGEEKEKPVAVMYSLPIIFEVK
ncbi:MAG: M56 family metallopeptidase [Gilvibacter sp.]